MRPIGEKPPVHVPAAREKGENDMRSKPIPQDVQTDAARAAQERALRVKCDALARKRYGKASLPPVVSERLARELDAICANSLIPDALLLAEALAEAAKGAGGVSFRGTIGSSFVAYLLGVTDIDPLPPHYRCPHCGRWEWVTDGSVGAGPDLRPASCPRCGVPMLRGGFDIPYETAFGLHGEKMPDFALEICSDARGPLEDAAESWLRGRWPDEAESLVLRGEKTDTMTEFFSPDGECLLALIASETRDLLAALGELTGTPAASVPLNDRRVLALFGDPREAAAALGLPPAQRKIEKNLRGRWAGMVGIPYCSSLYPVSGPQMGEGHSALAARMGRELAVDARENTKAPRQCGLPDLPSSRDEVFLSLLQGGVARRTAHEIAERVRRGRGLTERDKAAMREAGLPAAGADALGQVRYLWPKAHLLQRANDAIRFGWYKVCHPLAFYAAYFTAHTGDLSAECALSGHDALIGSLCDPHLPVLEEQEIEALLVAEEMTARGFSFLPPEKGLSDETRFLIEGRALRVPL